MSHRTPGRQLRPLRVWLITASHYLGLPRDGSGNTFGSGVILCHQVMTARPEYPRNARKINWQGSVAGSWSAGGFRSTVVGGYRIVDMDADFDGLASALKQVPDYILIDGGPTDMAEDGLTLSQVMTHYNSICAKAVTHFPDSIQILPTKWNFEPFSPDLGPASIAIGDAIRAGGVTSGNPQVLETNLAPYVFPPLAVYAYNSGDPGYPNGHPAVPNGFTDPSGWTGTLDPQNYGIVWLWANLHRFLLPDVPLPLRTGETYP